MVWVNCYNDFPALQFAVQNLKRKEGVGNEA